jgi:hypothetical protein
VVCRGKRKRLTGVDAVYAYTLLEETVDFAHLAQGRSRPSLFLDDSLDFFAEGLCVLRVRCKIVERKCENLRYNMTKDQDEITKLHIRQMSSVM